MNSIGKLLPNDGFLAIVKESPSIDYSKSLTHLYQPLLGMQAISLYQTLLNESLTNNAEIQTHHALMNYFQLSLPDIYQLRLKLEAIGLLRTYKLSDSGETVYTYEVLRPFSPASFFEETMLSELLLHHIGERRFVRLKERFAHKIQIEGKDITASFSSVFQTIDPPHNFEQMKPSDQSTNSLVETLDFSWLELMLKQRMLPVTNILTGANRRVISELTHLYNLATHEVEKAILWAVTDEHVLDVDQLKRACHDLYVTNNNGINVRLETKYPREKQTKTDVANLSREEQLIHRFETMSPRQLLEDLSEGKRASERDLTIIRDVMMDQGLSQPVMNVLVHYVLIQSNMKLSKPYLETIASHWSRANLSTAKSAMEFAKNEINEFKNRSTNRRNRGTSKEVIPDWFKERDNTMSAKKDHKSERDSSNVDQDEIMKMLQRHTSKNNNHMQG